MPTPILQKITAYSLAAVIFYLIGFLYACAFSIGMVFFHFIGLQFTTIYDSKTSNWIGLGVIFRPWWRKQ